MSNKENYLFKKIEKEKVYGILKAIKEIEKEEGDEKRIIPFIDLLNKIEKKCGKECKEIFYELLIEIPLKRINGTYKKRIDANEEKYKIKNMIKIKINGETQYLTKDQYNMFNWLKNKIQNMFGKKIILTSGYRSCGYQAILFFKNLVKYNLNVDETLKWVAPPGYSEHNIGKAIDIVSEEYIKNPRKFNESEEYEFLREIELIPLLHEPWHIEVKKIKKLDEAINHYLNKKREEIKEKALIYE